MPSGGGLHCRGNKLCPDVGDDVLWPPSLSILFDVTLAGGLDLLPYHHPPERPDMAKRTSDGTAATEVHEEAGGSGRILEEYLSGLKAIRPSGTGLAETSYHPALSNLFNVVGKSLTAQGSLRDEPQESGGWAARRRIVHCRPIPAPGRRRTTAK